MQVLFGVSFKGQMKCLFMCSNATLRHLLLQLQVGEMLGCAVVVRSG